MARTTTRYFEAVDWLPAFALTPKHVAQTFDTVTPARHYMPFCRFSWLKDEIQVYCRAPDPSDLFIFSDRELRARLRNFDPTDHSRAAQARRVRYHAQILENRINKTLDGFGSWDCLFDAIEVDRAKYLRQVDAGQPPTARAIQRIALKVPRVFCHLERCLPTKEMIKALRPFQPIIELGAGFGLVARALRQAAIDVGAVDKDEKESGFAYPVVPFDATTIHMTLDGKPATPLILWPHLDDDWFLHPFLKAKKGEIVALASPEFEHVMQGPVIDRKHVRANWSAGLKLQALLRKHFTQVGEAPTASAEPGSELVPLRLWRRL